jgi:response regulator RpfG family c-di-GMP phosphodiesterase
MPRTARLPRLASNPRRRWPPPSVDLGSNLLSAHVLVLDADEDIGPWMRDALLDAGLTCELVRESEDAGRRIGTQRPSLVVIPIGQIQRWAALLNELDQVSVGVPVLGAVSRDASIDFTAALALGVTDLVTYPCSTEDLVIRVASSMRRNERVPEKVEPASPMATLRSVTEAAEQALVRTETAAARVSRSEEREHLRAARDALAHSLQVILGTMIGNTEASGHGREGHAQLSAQLSRKLTTALGWPAARVRGIELAAMFGDIGLLAVQGPLLGVNGALTEQTLELVRTHPDTSAEILEPLSHVGVPVAAVRAHHERLDGSGYPKGLRGRQVPFGAQILGVVDCYAAMVRPRPHRSALSPEAALAELRDQAAAGRLSARLVELVHELVAGGTITAPPNGSTAPRHPVSGRPRPTVAANQANRPAPEGMLGRRPQGPGQTIA